MRWSKEKVAGMVGRGFKEYFCSFGIYASLNHSTASSWRCCWVSTEKLRSISVNSLLYTVCDPSPQRLQLYTAGVKHSSTFLVSDPTLTVLIDI